MTKRSWRFARPAVVFAVVSGGMVGIASPAQPQSRPLTVETLLLAVDRLLEARWYPTDPQVASTLTRDRQLLQLGLASQDARIRAAAVRSVGRFENPSDIQTLLAFFRDTDPVVRREAVNAIVMSVHRMPSWQKPVIDALVAMPRDSTVEEALASLHYSGQPPVAVLLLPARLLVRVIRSQPEVKLDRMKLSGLHDQARGSSTDPPDPDAIEILFRQHDYGRQEIWDAAQFTCPAAPNAPPGSCGWQERFVIAQLVEPKDAELGPLLTILSRDPVFQVRLAALRQLATAIPQTKSCRPLIDALADSQEVPVVKVEAIRLLDPLCEEHDDIVRRLADLARNPGGGSGEPAWVGARALEALPLFDPAQALAIVTDLAVVHPSATVRVSAARAATTLKHEAALVRLADDTNDNVRSEALAGLADLGSPQRVTFAMRALDSQDPRLIATAARALTKALDTDSVSALVAALNRLTKEGKDTASETRVAILNRLDEAARIKSGDTAPFASTVDAALWPLLRDFDPAVAAAAAPTVSFIRGSRYLAQPAHRPALQPREDELKSLVPKAVIDLSNGDQIELDLLWREAPITVARFVKLVRQHYYDGTEFYRVAPLIVAQGGSPGGHDYSGDARFVRDETGLERHTRGAVGMMTHGRDTGNMQFFIDLLDQPGFDREYTVFARVRPTTRPGTGLAAVDALAEGSKVVRITVSGG